jgi:DNA-binding transcriptional LysR family regulator
VAAGDRPPGRDAASAIRYFVLVSNYHAALQSFVLQTDAVTLTAFVTVRSRLQADGLAAVPIRNPELHQRTLQIQTMAGRTLPHTVQAFIELLTGAIDNPAVLD